MVSNRDILISEAVALTVSKLTLRSFSGSHTHGTILPSTTPLGANHSTGSIIQNGPPGGGGDGPPHRLSIGAHVTKTKRNQNAARRIQELRKARGHINQFWN